MPERVELRCHHRGNIRRIKPQNRLIVDLCESAPRPCSATFVPPFHTLVVNVYQHVETSNVFGKVRAQHVETEIEFGDGTVQEPTVTMRQSDVDVKVSDFDSHASDPDPGHAPTMDSFVLRESFPPCLDLVCRCLMQVNKHVCDLCSNTFVELVQELSCTQVNMPSPLRMQLWSGKLSIKTIMVVEKQPTPHMAEVARPSPLSSNHFCETVVNITRQ